MYSSKITELIEANKVTLSSTEYSLGQTEIINGMDYHARDEDARHVEDDDDEYQNDNNEDFSGASEQIYLNKLSTLKVQLKYLNDGTHKEFNRRNKEIIKQYTERIKISEEWRSYQIASSETDHELETAAAHVEFEEKKAELKENLQLELEDKKRIIEQERFSLDLNGDSMEYKPVSTRKLRRRGNEPQPIVEKRRKTITNSTEAVLDDKDIEDDLRKIFKNKPLNVKRSKPSIEYTADNGQNKKPRYSGQTGPPFRHLSPSSSPSYGGSRNDGHVLTRSGMSRTIR